MILDRDRLLGVAQAEREAIGRTIQYTDPEQWDRPSRLDGWATRDIVAHLAASEAGAAATLGGEPAAEIEEFLKSERDGLTLERFNDWTVERRRDAPFRAVVAEWGQNADAMLTRASRIPEGEWATRRVTWVTGEIPARFLLQSRVMEWWVHGEDIRASGGLAPRREHWPIFCTNDLAIRTLPWALGLAGLRFERRSIRFELEGSGEGSWHYGLAPRELPGASKHPDALVEGRADRFAEVASRRVPADVYVTDGSLVLSGDVDLAVTALTHIRAFA
ncbi:MAG: maleylpyruvate isomerase N-terminal domain-containing protein [Actinomycetota bacterium]